MNQRETLIKAVDALLDYAGECAVLGTLHKPAYRGLCRYVATHNT